MQGPPAEASPYGTLQHLVLIPHLAAETEWHAYKNAQRVAACKAAVYLGQAALGQQANTSEVLDLDEPHDNQRESLPRIAYIAQISSGQMGVDPDEQIFYGSNLLGFIPTIVHPNEWLDGAVVTSHTGASSQTYLYQNNPIILDLYNRHMSGKINFVGVIATTAPGIENERARNTMYSAHLAKWNLRADGVLVDRYPAGGATHADMIETARQCELIGVKTVVFLQDSAGDRRVESASLINIAEVKDVVIVAGGFGSDVKWQLPASTRVIGGNPDIAERLAEPQEVGAGQICGVAGVQGGSELQSVLY
jgi:glycine reductase